MTAETDAGRGGPVLAGLRRTAELLQRIPRRSAWIPILLWMALIFVLSEIPAEPPPPGKEDEINYWGNLGHPGVYGLLTLWMILALPRKDGWVVLSTASKVVLVLATVAYGVTDEFHQHFVPGRFPSAFDLAADGLGAACVLWIVAYAGRREATERGVVGRLLIGLVLCIVITVILTQIEVGLATTGPG